MNKTSSLPLWNTLMTHNNRVFISGSLDEIVAQKHVQKHILRLYRYTILAKNPHCLHRGTQPATACTMAARIFRPTVSVSSCATSHDSLSRVASSLLRGKSQHAPAGRARMAKRFIRFPYSTGSVQQKQHNKVIISEKWRVTCTNTVEHTSPSAMRASQ